MGQTETARTPRPTGLRTWIEVSKKALENNLQTFRDLITKKVKIMAVAKSNAYGHGLTDYARFMEDLGVDWLGVDSITEALALRKNGLQKPLLVLGYTLPENLAAAAKNNISLTVSNFESLESLTKLKRQPQIHLKIDTGLHRQGFLLKDLSTVAHFIQSRLDAKTVEAVYTHLAAVKNSRFLKETFQQGEEFKQAVRILKDLNPNIFSHAAATAAAVGYPKFHHDLVRIGIGLYGLWPSPEVFKSQHQNLKLVPALSWKTIISEIKKLPKGSRIGYDFTESLGQDATVAICPVGYWHGFDRHLSGRGRVLIKGKTAKVLGRVSMDMIVVNVSRIPQPRVGDVVILIENKENSAVYAEKIAKLLKTTSYEILTRLNPLMKRIYL